MQKIIVVLFAVIIQACTAMNKDECEMANWQAVGYQYGVKGENASAFQKYQNECAAHRVKADYEAFKLGYQEGLNDYCSYERGKEIGVLGAKYNAQCKSSEFPRFNQGYQEGTQQYCSFERGKSVGASGAKASAQCPASQYSVFNQGYLEGIQIFCSYERGAETGDVGGDYNATCPSSEFPQFSQGYNLGLSRYCHFENGYQIGYEGEAANLNCSVEQFQTFHEGYKLGKLHFSHKTAINQLKNQLLGLDKKIQSENAKIERIEESIVSENSTQEMRRKALKKIKSHQQTLSQLKQQYVEIESEITFLEAQLMNSID